MSERSYHGATSHSPTHWMRLSEGIDITRALQYECGNCNRKNVGFFCVFFVCLGFALGCLHVRSLIHVDISRIYRPLFVCLLFVCCLFVVVFVVFCFLNFL